MSHFSGKNIWILKPTGLNRGKGIHVVDQFQEIKRIIKQTCLENASNKV
jgi:phosphoribosylamine-glycine ligase